MKLKKKEIEAEFKQAGIAQGSTGMIKGYQKAVGCIMGKLTQEERDAVVKQADEWNEEQLLAEVQAE